MGGETIGGYRVVRRLGSGTMGVVYLAQREREGDPQDAGNKVAIKRVHGHAGTAERARLRREAHVLAGLTHPNIIRILEVIDEPTGADGGDPDDGHLALVLPYATGGTLATRLAERGALAPDEVRSILAPIADALAHAHAAGVLHRDVKPSNILFLGDGTPVLADFGIARDAGRSNITRTDLAIGTAAYLDPDVADGAEPSAASDVYALGVVAYEALTGAPPFHASTPLAVLRAADRGEFAPLLRATTGPLAEVVERAFARRPHDRWASASTFAAALRGEPVDDPAGARIDETTTLQRRTRAPLLEEAPPVTRSRRRRVGAVAGAALVVALGAGIAVPRVRSDALPTLPVPALPRCSPQTDAQCVRRYVRTAKGVKVDFATGESTEFRFGRGRDAIRVANFFCGEGATAAIYRPDDGFVEYLSNWPDPASDERSEMSVDATGIIGGTVSVGDKNHDGCADLAIDRAGVRTWFLPSTQTRRLERGTLEIATSSGRSS